MNSKIYDEKFYDSVTQRADLTSSNAASLLKSFLEPRSLIDVGSGQGIWSANFVNTLPSINHVTAIDLDSRNIHLLSNGRIPQNVEVELLSCNLSETPQLPDLVFDLGICVEVLEHLKKVSAEKLMEEFGLKCKFMVFSAALKGQGGTDHINENTLDYWNSEMHKNGFVPLDIFRNVFIRNSKIPTYYSNSIALWVNTKFISGKNMSEIISWTDLITAFPGNLSDLRSPLSKFRFRILSWFPVSFVTRLAILKNRYQSKFD